MALGCLFQGLTQVFCDFVPVSYTHLDVYKRQTYAYGGAELLLKTLQDYYKVDVSKYVRVNFTIFEEGITDIGEMCIRDRSLG